MTMGVVIEESEITFSEMPKRKNFNNLYGKSFGRLTVLGYAGRLGGRRGKWFCRCVCGKFVAVLSVSLLHGGTKSCGCLTRHVTSDRSLTHGQLNSGAYKTWSSMIQRCTNENNDAYHNYGGRGIKVCESWLNFWNFYADMGDRPVGMSLDRKENNGNYEQGNCRWATKKEQVRNTRSNRVVEIDGVSKCVIDWAKHQGAALYTTILYRLNRGWTHREAVFGKSCGDIPVENVNEVRD